MSKKKYPGLFVVIEGADNCGKTTQARRLISALRRRGYDVLPVREPGGTEVSEKIRRILLSRRSQMCAPTELLLYLAARSQVTAEKIIPALKAGKIVIADRYHLSTYAYQIGGRGIPPEVVYPADAFARHGLQPDLMIMLDITTAEARRRLRASGKTADRIESERPVFFARVRRYYRLLAAREKKIILLDGSRPAGELATEIRSRVLKLCL